MKFSSAFIILSSPALAAASVSTDPNATPAQELTGDALIYEEAINKHHPRLYDRSNGWFGQTHEEGLHFCGRMEGYELCSYDAVCPLGPGKEPLSSFAEESNEWVPITDTTNEWVQIGRDDPCEPTLWGTNAIGREAVTRNILCCIEPGFVLDQDAPPNEHLITESPLHAEADTRVLYYPRFK